MTFIRSIWLSCRVLRDHDCCRIVGFQAWLEGLDSYFLGGKCLPWYLLGISDASGMFDITGTMLMVYWLFVYGLKSIWLPFCGRCSTRFF